MSSVRILVVDDLDEWRTLISCILQKDPLFEVACEAPDGLKAVQMAEEAEPAVVLLDIRLPKLNGIEAARRIQKVSPETKIVFVSGECDPDIVKATLEVGAHAYVFKPDAPRELLTALCSVVRGQRFVSSGLSSYGFLNVT